MYETVIGLEVHVQLSTKSKIFCSCSNNFGKDSNTQTCPVCLGLPGALPVFNEDVLNRTILAGLAVHCTISKNSKFDRKNYFYPDLPKAYQISQFDMPICKNGYIEVIDKSNEKKKIRVNRIHMEEDAGKSIHTDLNFEKISMIDLNRTGTPLMEIVTEPDISSSDEAYQYLQTIKETMKYLEVSDCNMEQGSLRCDVNVSIREKGETQLGCKVEIKNMNSFKAVKSAIDYEVKRQIDCKETKTAIIQETRLWDADKLITVGMRSKEGSHDYRYFPDPDLPLFIVDDVKIEKIKKMMPEMRAEKIERYLNDFCLTRKEAENITIEKNLAVFFEKVIQNGINPKKAANWILNELLARVSDIENIDKCNVSPANLSSLISSIDSNIINGKIAKEILTKMLSTGKAPQDIIKDEGITQITDMSEIEKTVDSVIDANPQSVLDFKAGKEKAIGFLVGQVMKNSGGKANPQKVNEIIISKLKGITNE